MDRVTCYLLFILLIGNNDAIPLANNVTAPVKDMIFTADVLENDSAPTVPLLWHFGEKSYYLGTIFKANFFEAEEFCSLHGMRLVSILSNEENVFLGEKLYDNGFTGATDLFWTSGTKLPDEEHWVWLTAGTRISFTNWAPGEPNNVAKLEKCLEVNRYKIVRKRDLFWNDLNCISKNYFICEFSRPRSISHVIVSLKSVLNSTESVAEV